MCNKIVHIILKSKFFQDDKLKLCSSKLKDNTLFNWYHFSNGCREGATPSSRIIVLLKPEFQKKKIADQLNHF